MSITPSVFLARPFRAEAQAGLADRPGYQRQRSFAPLLREYGGEMACQSVSILSTLAKARVPVQAVFLRDDADHSVATRAEHALQCGNANTCPATVTCRTGAHPDAIASLIS
jgi:hypothetical protein